MEGCGRVEGELFVGKDRGEKRGEESGVDHNVD